MKWFNSFTMILATALLFSACDSPKEKALADIKTMEDRDSIFSPEQAENMKEAYLAFAEKYPDDELAPEFMFKAAQRCNVIGQYEEGINLFNKIREKYPKHRISEEALFVQGYVYETYLHNLEKAKEVYTRFVNEYPNSELAEDATISISHLGETPEQLLQNALKKDSAGVN